MNSAAENPQAGSSDSPGTAASPLATVNVPLAAIALFGIFVWFTSALLLRQLPENSFLSGLPGSVQAHVFTVPITLLLLGLLSRGYVDLHAMFAPVRNLAAIALPVIALSVLSYSFNVTLLAGMNCVAVVCNQLEIECPVRTTTAVFGFRSFPADIRFLVAVGLAALAAPFVEEVFFRGLLLGRLAMAMRPAWALAISTVLFGLIHTGPGMLYAVVGGLLFGYVYLKTGNLWLSFLLHAISNLTTRLAVFVVDIEPVESDEIQLVTNLLALVAVTAVQLVLIPYFLAAVPKK